MKYIDSNRTNLHTHNYEYFSENSIVNAMLRIDRRRMLDFIGLNDFGVFLRKLNKSKYYSYSSSFECALRERMVSIYFIDKYKDLKIFPSLIGNVLDNPVYTEKELITIIEKFPTYINWYDVFYNQKFSIEYKAKNYDKIYADFLKSFDINTTMATRIIKTNETLSSLKL